MNWYYIENKVRQGPVDEVAFKNLAEGGRITPETMVWQEGMTDWVPLSTVRNRIVTADGRARCVECGADYPAEEMIVFGQSRVCAGCKAVFFQKVKEGVVSPATMGGEHQFGGFWIRFAAIFIDGLIMLIPMLLVIVPIALISSSETMEKNFGMMMLLQVVQMILQYGIMCAYFTFFHGRNGQTPGKRVCGLKVVRTDGTPMTYGRAFGRFWAYVLSGLILYIGYIMAGFDPEKRALHDRLCDTRVIKI
ncbi:MAG: RDD family protein [Verrucomicrobiae bacterium]|nr:RDD family protein [Verrucomicrobiae bacterium]